MFARVGDLDGQHVVPLGQHPHRRLPAGCDEKVGDDHDQAPALAIPLRRAIADSRSVTPAPSSRGLGDLVQDPKEVLARAARRDDPTSCLGRSSADRQHGADPVAVAVGQEADGGRRGQHKLAFLGAGRPEVEPGRAVDEQPGLQLPLGDRLADVGLGKSGGDVPVDATDVVTGGVAAGLAQFGSVTGDQPSMVAVEEAVEPCG